jgi:PleD family two-component response regulator
VAAFPSDGATPEVLFEIADASLYRAKAEGRDRVVYAAATA